MKGWERIVEAAGTAAMETINTKMPRFPRVSEWVGGLAAFALTASSWVGLWIGIMKFPLLALYARSCRVRFGRLPLKKRVMIGVGTGLVAGFFELLEVAGAFDLKTGEIGEELSVGSIKEAEEKEL